MLEMRLQLHRGTVLLERMKNCTLTNPPSYT
jgi:hypothetical protein